jgi:hypothetical protein
VVNQEWVRHAQAKLEQEKGQQSLLLGQRVRANARLKGLEEELEYIEEARWVIQEVAQKTQQQISFHVSGIVSRALAAVFPDPYEFVMDWVKRRGKTECDLLFERDGERVHPLDASGGGPADVTAFALRIAALLLESPPSRRVLIADEPFRFVSADLQHRCALMIREISERLRFQIIMVSHSEDLIAGADRAFETDHRRWTGGGAFPETRIRTLEEE